MKNVPRTLRLQWTFEIPEIHIGEKCSKCENCCQLCSKLSSISQQKVVQTVVKSKDFKVFIKCFILLQTSKHMKFFILNRSPKGRNVVKFQNISDHAQHKIIQSGRQHTHVKNVMNFSLNDFFLTTIEFILRRSTTTVKGVSTSLKTPYKKGGSSQA